LAGKYKSAGSVLPDGKTLRRQLAASFRYIKYPILTSIIAVWCRFSVLFTFRWFSVGWVLTRERGGRRISTQTIRAIFPADRVAVSILFISLSNEAEPCRRSCLAASLSYRHSFREFSATAN